MRDILQKYVGQDIGMNIHAAFKVEQVTLIQVTESYFTVKDHTKNYTHHFSYFSIVQIIESDNGIDLTGFLFHKEHFAAVIKVGHLYEHIPG